MEEFTGHMVEMRPERWVGPDGHSFMGHGRRLCVYPKSNGQLLEIFKEKELGD